MGDQIQIIGGLECWTKEFDKGVSPEEGDHVCIFKKFTLATVYRMTSRGTGLKLMKS